MTSPLDEVYEKYKHLDGCLSDPEWCTSGEGAAIYAIAGELWNAVKEARDVQQEIMPSSDIIADLRRSLEFYRARMNNLQWWQSSMRDPERKIVCDILANGFTLTTKEEINNAGNQPRPPCEECRINSIIEQKRGCLTCRNLECPIWQAADQNCWKSQEGHDASIAAQATAAEMARLTHGRKVITLCGSVKFWDEYIRQNAVLTLQGNIVLSCGHSLKEGYEDILVDLPIDDVKRDLDFLHLRKIDLSDEIFVLNVGGYIGDSTQREIEYALSTGKKVKYLESLSLAQPEIKERDPE
jgi:hypothetical protein